MPVTAGGVPPDQIHTVDNERSDGVTHGQRVEIEVKASQSHGRRKEIPVELPDPLTDGRGWRQYESWAEARPGQRSCDEAAHVDVQEHQGLDGLSHTTRIRHNGASVFLLLPQEQPGGTGDLRRRGSELRRRRIGRRTRRTKPEDGIGGVEAEQLARLHVRRCFGADGLRGRHHGFELVCDL